MKRILFIMAYVLLAIGLAGCSSDSPLQNESDNGFQGTTDKMVDFKLQNEDGIECYRFKKGDNIIFRLDIINNGEEDVIIHNDIGYIIGNDVFHVYSSKGEDFGTPYDVLIIPEVGLTIIPSKSKVSFLCPWVNDSNSGISWNPRYLNYEIGKLRSLPMGDYYSQFTIRLDDNRFVTCKRTFKIEK